MKYTPRFILTLALQATMAAAMAKGLGTWQVYNAYAEVQDIAAAGSAHLFVMASNRLYMYNTNDESITTFDKVSNLHDTNVAHIGWNSTARRLVVVYDNSNIDLVETDATVTNISDLYDKSMVEDKTVNSLKSDGRYTYLATNFGVIRLDAVKKNISETYYLGVAVKKIGFGGGNIYALDAAGAVHVASKSGNLIDKSSWTTTTNYDPTIFADDTSDFDKYYPTVTKLDPEGPASNGFYSVKMANGHLYTTGGMFSANTEASNKGSVQVWDGYTWQNYQQDSIAEATGHRYEDIDCVARDPKQTNADHVFAGGKTGLYEFVNGRFKQAFNLDNSPLQSSLSSKDYVVVNGMTFDSDGNLWLLNSKAPSKSLLEYTSSGQWIDHHHQELMYNSSKSLDNMVNPFFDSRGLLWFCNDHYRKPSVVCYNKTADDVTIFDNFTNQDNTQYTTTAVHCAAEDIDGNIWVGTSNGLFYLTPEYINNKTNSFMQYKVARNDGTNNADYLLADIGITSIAVDGGNRKWIGTESNGVYVVSADNNTQVANFTVENSGLVSNQINGIAINGTTGEVFFATQDGLCSYTSDATESAEEMDKDNVYAYPNPVTPGYTGLITIVGLSYNADVKIATATGRVVAEGRSTGGTFTWNGLDRDGKRVASGVYNVLTAKQDGSKGTVCKVAVVN